MACLRFIGVAVRAQRSSLRRSDLDPVFLISAFEPDGDRVRALFVLLRSSHEHGCHVVSPATFLELIRSASRMPGGLITAVIGISYAGNLLRRRGYISHGS